MEKEGYEFINFLVGAMDDEDEFNFDAEITEDTVIYAHYHKLSQYEVLSSSTNKIISYDFSQGTKATKVTKLEFENDKPAFQYVNDGDLNLNDEGAILNENAIAFNFGQKYESGLLKVYFEASFEKIEGESFFQINGTNDTSYERVFELRTDSDKFGYSFDGLTRISLDTAVTVKTRYGFYIELDMSSGTVSINITNPLNGDTLKSVDNIVTIIKGANGLKFQAKSEKKSTKTIDNLAATFEAKKKSEFVKSKEAAIKTIDTYLASAEYTGLNAENGDDKAKIALIDAQVAKSKKAINDSSNDSELSAATTEWSTFAAAKKCVVTVNAYTAAGPTNKVEGATYYIAVIEDSIIDTSKIQFKNYVIEGIYIKESDFSDSNIFVNTTKITDDLNLFAKVSKATITTITYTPKKPAATDSWKSNGSYKAEQADASSTKYSCLQLAYDTKQGSEKDYYLQTPNFEDATKSVTINMTGFTGGNSSISKYGKITAYNSSNVEIGSVDIYTPADKKYGSFTSDSSGNVKDIVVTSSTDNIAYLKITCVTSGKSYFIVSLSVSYNK